MTSGTGSATSMKIGVDFVVSLATFGNVPVLVFETKNGSLLKAMAVVGVGGRLSLDWLAKDAELGISSAKVVYGTQAFLIVWRPTTVHAIQAFDVIAVER